VKYKNFGGLPRHLSIQVLFAISMPIGGLPVENGAEVPWNKVVSLNAALLGEQVRALSLPVLQARADENCGIRWRLGRFFPNCGRFNHAHRFPPTVAEA